MLKLTTDRHEASHGLFATAELLVYTALVLVNAYKCAKVQLPSSISYGYMEGVQK